MWVYIRKDKSRQQTPATNKNTEMKKMSETTFNMKAFERDLAQLQGLVQERIQKDKVMDNFEFGVDFGMTYNRMTKHLTSTHTGRLSRDDRIELMPLKRLCFKYMEWILKACAPAVNGPQRDWEDADFLWAAHKVVDEIKEFLKELKI